MATFIRIIVILVCIAGLGMASVIFGETLVEWWIPVVLCLSVSAAAAVPLGRRMKYLTTSSNRYVNFAAALVMVFSVVAGGLFTLNYYGSDRNSRSEVKAEVARKYRKTRHRSRRVSRRVYTQGEKYYVYYFELALPGGRRKELHVDTKQYHRTREGAVLTLEVEKGLFGVPVIKEHKIPVPPHTPRNQGRRMFPRRNPALD